MNPVNYIKVEAHESRTICHVITIDTPPQLSLVCEIEDYAHLKIYIMALVDAQEKQVTLTIRQAGRHSKTECYIAQHLTGSAKTHIMMKHEQAGSESTHTFKHRALVDNAAQLKLDACISIERGATLACADQTSEVLLLNEQARAQTVPALEILQHDVSCTHGTAVGTVDDEMLFYLASRGIAPVDARKLIVNSFLQEFFDKYFVSTHDYFYPYISW